MDIIRFCRRDEEHLLREFIHSKWKENHILAVNPTLLQWQHLNAETDNLNFVVAYNEQLNNFTAILGFIPLHHFDSTIEECHIWLAIWKTDIDTADSGVGLQLFDFLKMTLRPITIGAISINSNVKKIYKLLGFELGVLNHYFLLNSNIENYKIAQIPIKFGSTNKDSRHSLREIIDVMKYEYFSSLFKPKKSVRYLINRYINHPIYKYKLIGIFTDDILNAIFVMRKVSVNKSNCIRIVDIYGDLQGIGTIASELLRVMQTENAEYIDCLNFGIDESIFNTLGFVRTDSRIIIPNYFEPFEKRSVEIEFAIYPNTVDYVIFRGDSDQDRPNQIN